MLTRRSSAMPADDENDRTSDYYLMQAARCRRLAADLVATRPDIAAELEDLAQQFERRVAVMRGAESKSG